MIRENQKLLNYLNILSDAVLIYLSLPLAFFLRFYVLPGGIISLPLSRYLSLNVILTLLHLFTYGAMGLYRSFRHVRLSKELAKLFVAGLLNMAILLSVLFVRRGMSYSRVTLALYLVLTFLSVGGKRVVLRTILRRFRKLGYNQKHVLLLGSGETAKSYLAALKAEPELGYRCLGYLADSPFPSDEDTPRHLGSYDDLDMILEKKKPDEVVSAIEVDDFRRTPALIAACEKAGVKLSIIPFYAAYMPGNPEFDELGGLPLLNIRHIPLDNLLHAFVKRSFDIVVSALLLLLTSPLLAVCAVGVRLSSPGPILFRQERIGRNKKPFYMYKFRSMRVNGEEKTGWTTAEDSRRTPFGSFLRKYSIDELPQLWNVLKGDMSLVGPRPEVPFFVDKFKEEVPLYMVKHQVRPGITGWAQVNGYRGDTSIPGRIRHDIWYIEHWSFALDLKILFLTVFGGKFLNKEEK